MTFPPMSLSKGRSHRSGRQRLYWQTGCPCSHPRLGCVLLPAWLSAAESFASLRSIGRESPDIESQSHILFISVLMQRVRLSVLVHQCEIRSKVADFDLRRRACLSPATGVSRKHASKSAILTLCIASSQVGKSIRCIFGDIKCGSSSVATDSDVHLSASALVN
jgi:hypothetical protein